MYSFDHIIYGIGVVLHVLIPIVLLVGCSSTPDWSSYRYSQLANEKAPQECTAGLSLSGNSIRVCE